MQSQMVIQAVLLGFRIEEVAIPTRYAEDSSSVDVISSVRYILETFGALSSSLRHRERLRREYVEGSNTLGL